MNFLKLLKLKKPYCGFKFCLILVKLFNNIIRFYLTENFNENFLLKISYENFSYENFPFIF